MSNSLPVVPDTTFTEREGIGYVGLTASRMGLIWREVSNTDLGIDGYLEAVVNGAPIGLIAVQVKSGPKYIKSVNKTRFSFYAEGKHVRYWLSYRLPVIIIVYDPSVKVAYWRYIQDYFAEHNDVPASTTPTIHFSRQVRFDESSREQLIKIASTPDSTANAMLALRACRYAYTQELPTPIEMIELYGKRKWLGEWLPLDAEREEILIHSTLARRGPAWYWFRSETNRDYTPYLRSGLKHPDPYIQGEAALTLAADLGYRAVGDLRELLENGHNIFKVTEALATIPDLTSDDRRQIVETCWQQYSINETVLSGELSLRFISLMSKIGGQAAGERIINHYVDAFAPHRIIIRTGIVRPPLLRNADYLVNVDDLSRFRQYVEKQELGLQDLAIVILAKKGEKQDCDLLLSYIEASEWNGSGYDDISWLSKEAAHLFSVEHLEFLRNLLRRATNYSLQALAHRVLPRLCCRLDKVTLLEMLTDPIPVVRSYAAEGLVAIGKATELLKYEAELLNHTDLGARVRSSAALTAVGDWAVIDRLLKNENADLQQGVAEGLRAVKDDQTYNYLFDLIQSEGTYDDDSVHLKAANSLSVIGNEDDLSRVLNWLLNHSYKRSTDLMTSVLIHLDHKLYCPIQRSLDKESDFSMLRYSLRRDEYR
jgi:hypothetical protein